MKTVSATTFTADIYIAGDAASARHVCRKYCMDTGFCVTVAECEFVYTGGQESGVRVGIINYPRFPDSPENLLTRAMDLAERLRAELCQHSYSIVTPDTTIWVSERK